MITEETMYWVTRLDHIHDLLIGLACFGFFGAFVCLIIYAMIFDFYKEKKNSLVIGIILLSILGFICVTGKPFLPTTKEYAVIKVVPAVVNNEKIQAEASDLYAFCKEWLHENLPIKETKKVEKE